MSSAPKSSALHTAWEKALGGGIPGIAAQATQVCMLAIASLSMHACVLFVARGILC